MLYQKQSDISGAGNGLFAGQDIPKDTRICEYAGEILDKDEICDIYMVDPESYCAAIHPYVRDLDRDRVVVGIPNIDMRRSGVLVNDAAKLCPPFSEDRVRDYREQSGAGANVYPVVENGRIYYHASRDISKDEELYSSYGAGYWLLAHGIAASALGNST